MKNRYSISSSKNVYSVVEYKINDTKNKVSVIGTYDNVSAARDVANRQFQMLQKSFVEKFGVGGFVADKRNKSLCSNDNRNRCVVVVCDNLNFSTGK